MTTLWFLLGLVALVAGAEFLVRGSSRLALSCGISPLVVGLTVVAFGTSAPEIAVSVSSALTGQSDIAVGNVIGSNIFNVLFILGVSALITPLLVHGQIIKQEMPIMLGASLLLLVLAFDGTVGRLDAALLLVLLVLYTVFLILQSRAQSKATVDEFASGVPPRGGFDRHWSVQVGLIVVGFVLLVVGSQLLVDACVEFAKALGVSEMVIGLTIVAAGTSMPELATSVMAAIRGERDIAIGNVVGSNTFNILGCLGTSGLVTSDGLAVAPALLHFDIWVMIAVALACVPVFFTGREIARWEGVLFLLYYAAYTTYLILAAQKHEALIGFNSAMASFVLPLTIVAFVVSFVRGKSPVQTE